MQGSWRDLQTISIVDLGRIVPYLPLAQAEQLGCQSEDVYQIFYSTYLEGEAYGQGGWADLDGKALTPETSLTASFDKEYFEGKDISTLSMDFSPYGEGDTVELATTEQVAIPAEYGETYTILFTGDEESGFTAQLRP